MRRPALLILATMATLLAIPSLVAGSERERSMRMIHPLIGTWIVDVDTAGTFDPPALVVIAGDGTVTLTDCCSAPAAGAWAPSSTRTADVTLLAPWTDEDGSFIGFNTVRADVVVSADGQTLSATYTSDAPDGQGGTSGQLGPSTATGVRVWPERMGEPVGPVPVPPTEDASDTAPVSSEPSPASAEPSPAS